MAVRSEEFLTECDEPLDPMDAAGSDGDQQLERFVTDDAPEKTIADFFRRYSCAVWKPSSYTTFTDQVGFAWTDVTLRMHRDVYLQGVLF